ncbi:MAG: hypothetical protein NC121_14505 [Blautia sp.]|nr:hypothetical protein [Acetatifactor muris]MCM1542452.1 hypothetical protein [Blautia sp.]
MAIYFLIISSVTNADPDVLLVVVFRLGVVGAVLATVRAQALSTVLCGLYIRKNYKEYLPGKEYFAVEKGPYTEMLSIGFSMAMMQCIFAIGPVILQRKLPK